MRYPGMGCSRVGPQRMSWTAKLLCDLRGTVVLAGVRGVRVAGRSKLRTEWTAEEGGTWLVQGVERRRC